MEKLSPCRVSKRLPNARRPQFRECRPQLGPSELGSFTLRQILPPVTALSLAPTTTCGSNCLGNHYMLCLAIAMGESSESSGTH